MRKRQIAIVIICCWIFIIIAFMLAAQRFDLEIFFVLWLIGILIVIELIEFRYFQTPHLKKLKMVIGIGVLIFAYIVAQKVMVILNL